MHYIFGKTEKIFLFILTGFTFVMRPQLRKAVLEDKTVLKHDKSRMHGV